MLLPYRIIVVLGLTVALATAWSVAPVEGPAAVDADVLKLAQGFRTPTETSVSNVKSSRRRSRIPQSMPSCCLTVSTT